ncbi:DUF6734 family protein [Bradyrhizobium sp. Arg816]|uniref:DUF6734 family protein n=1 Tax=Bradyrhizobium sp. Arg816 TaxID=2998491 RepID=UPI00249F34AB|nr:DUF6734 family protein [Bradyrhizobium sp. Arg816]MDI3560172.1 hypothetical protein [Bradyrhizobium sp. Arg816]
MVLRSVWSFWTKPYRASREASWADDWYHWLAWGLSVHAARQHYPETVLVTDDAGARVLVDALELPFVEVSTALNDLDADPDWWALGKLEAYRSQKAPFVHIDADVFLWTPLAPALDTAPVFAQHPEPIPSLSATCYRPDVLEAAVEPEPLPVEWAWYRKARADWRGACCGVFGGAHTDFIQHYAAEALRLATDARYSAGMARLGDKSGHMILLEQYLLSACVEYHAQRPGSAFADVEIHYIFDCIEEAYNSGTAEAAGYTHLAGGTKRNRRICRALERRVRQDLPLFYARCQERAHRFGAALAET